jgi:hypothetical protein
VRSSWTPVLQRINTGTLGSQLEYDPLIGVSDVRAGDDEVATPPACDGRQGRLVWCDDEIADGLVMECRSNVTHFCYFQFALFQPLFIRTALPFRHCRNRSLVQSTSLTASHNARATFAITSLRGRDLSDLNADLAPIREGYGYQVRHYYKSPTGDVEIYPGAQDQIMEVPGPFHGRLAGFVVSMSRNSTVTRSSQWLYSELAMSISANASETLAPSSTKLSQLQHRGKRRKRDCRQWAISRDRRLWASRASGHGRYASLVVNSNLLVIT